jgi:cytoskeletal protein CcmA (bactofilin family)
VGGSLNVTGGSITIDGNVEGSVRVFGGDTIVSGAISGDLVVFGGSMLIGETASIDGDLLVYGGQVDLLGTIGGNVNGSVGLMSIEGTVARDVDLDVQMLTVTSQAQIDGSLDYVSRQEATIRQGADIGGDVNRVELSSWGTGDGLRAQLFSPLIRTLWLLAAGVVMIALAPRFAAAVSGNVRRPWIPALVGLVSMAALPALAILLMVSVIGIPVGVILLALFLISLYLSQVVVGQRLGTLILPRGWNDGSRGFLLLSMTLGVILISAFRFVPLPFVSTVVNLLVAIIGLGAMVLLVRQLRPGYVFQQR